MVNSFGSSGSAINICVLFTFRLDAEKEVDSLDILGDLDFKVRSLKTTHAVYNIDSIFELCSIFSQFKEFVAIMKEVAQSFSSPEV